MIQKVMMRWKKFLLTNQNFKRKSSKEKPEAEWEFQNRFLVLLTRRKPLNWNQSQNPSKPSSWFKALSVTPFYSKISTIKMKKLWLTPCKKEKQLKVRQSSRKVKMVMLFLLLSQVNMNAGRLSMVWTNSLRLTSMEMHLVSWLWCTMPQEQLPLRLRHQEHFIPWTELPSVKLLRMQLLRRESFTKKWSTQLKSLPMLVQLKNNNSMTS